MDGDVSLECHQSHSRAGFLSLRTIDSLAGQLFVVGSILWQPEVSPVIAKFPCEGKIALLSRLYLFPVAIVTNCHRFSALKQQISFLMVLEVRNSKARIAKFKSRAMFCLEAAGKICFSAFSSFYKPPAWHNFPCLPFPCLPGQLHSIFKSFSMTPFSLSRLLFWLLPPFYKDSLDNPR